MNDTHDSASICDAPAVGPTGAVPVLSNAECRRLLTIPARPRDGIAPNRDGRRIASPLTGPFMRAAKAPIWRPTAPGFGASDGR